MEFKDYYQILGVERKATAKEIKAAYRALARNFHPDLHPGDHEVEKKFSDINEAYEVLQDEEKRKQFDEIADYVAVQGHPPRPEEAYDDEVDAASFFEQFFGRRHSRATARPGADLHTEVEITLQEASSGTTRQLTLNRQDLCPLCQGSGLHDRRLCHTCRGLGQVLVPQSLEVKIPAGVTEESVVRLPGLGGPGSPRGDLLLVIALSPDPVYRVEGYDLHRDLEVSIFTAILGGEVQVEALKGKLGLKLPPDTQNGKVFRLRGQGLARSAGKPAGDLYVTISLRIPTGITEQTRQQLRQLRDQVERG